MPPPLATPAFLRACAVCCAISALTTLGLIFLPYGYAALVDGDTTRRLLDPVYMTRVWVALVHPLIVLVGALGVCVARVRVAPGAALVGFVFFLLWAGTEGVQLSLTLVAVNWTWRAGALEATDPAARERLLSHLDGFEAVSDGLFFFLLIAFFVANLAYAVAVWGGGRLQRTVAVGFVFAAGLTAISGLTSFGGGVLPDAVMAVLYPVLQPPARLLTGIWLWQQAAGTPSPAVSA
jgi:hypothetical protein